MPFTIVQLTDPHVGASWSQDPVTALAAAVAAVGRTLPGGPDAVIVSGDVANTPSDGEYEQARRELDPPAPTGIPAMDAIGIPEPERRSLSEIVSRHPQVRLIAAGHLHRTIVGELGGVPILAIPSTDAQLALDFESDELRFVPEPPCFAVHALVDGRLVSHVQPVMPRA